MRRATRAPTHARAAIGWVVDVTTEPEATAAGMAALIVGLSHQQLGPWGVVLGAAILGAMVRLSRQRTSYWEGFKYVFRAAAVASCCGFFIVYWVAIRMGWPGAEAAGMVAFVIGLRADHLIDKISSIGGGAMPAPFDDKRGDDHA